MAVTSNTLKVTSLKYRVTFFVKFVTDRYF